MGGMGFAERMQLAEEMDPSLNESMGFFPSLNIRGFSSDFVMFGELRGCNFLKNAAWIRCVCFFFDHLTGGQFHWLGGENMGAKKLETSLLEVPHIMALRNHS